MGRSLKTRQSSFTFAELVGKAMREGSYATIRVRQGNLNVPVSGTADITDNATASVATEHFIAQELNVIANKDFVLQLNQVNGPIFSIPDYRFSIQANQQFRQTLNELWYSCQNTPIQARGGDGTATYNIYGIVSGYRITADLNFNADKVMMWVGDSITRGTNIGGTYMTDSKPTAGVLTPRDHFTFQVRDHFQRQGIDCRLIVKAVAGFDSLETGVWVDQGWLDVEQCDVIFYQHGVNDAFGGNSDVQYQAELDKIVDWRDRKFPDAKIVFVGDSPLNDNTLETRLGQLRALKAAMASAPDNIYYVSLASAFDRTNLANYNGSDGIHPNIASNALMADVINAWIDANNFTF